MAKRSTKPKQDEPEDEPRRIEVVEVTPEMIEAGVDALYRHEFLIPEFAVEEVFQAMFRARRSAVGPEENEVNRDARPASGGDRVTSLPGHCIKYARVGPGEER